MSTTDLFDSVFKSLDEAATLLRASRYLSGPDLQETLEDVDAYIHSAYYVLSQVWAYIEELYEAEEPTTIERPNISYEDQIDVAYEMAYRFEDMLWESETS